jgi:hypothetical protein
LVGDDILEAVMDAHLRPDGSVNYEFHRAQALRSRNAYLGELLPQVELPPLSPVARRRFKMCAAAFAVATAAFWATMATMPPTTEASAPSFSVGDLHRSAPLSLPNLVADPF